MQIPRHLENGVLGLITLGTAERAAVYDVASECFIDSSSIAFWTMQRTPTAKLAPQQLKTYDPGRI